MKIYIKEWIHKEMNEWMNNKSTKKISIDVVGSLFLSRSGTRQIPRMFSHKRSQTFIEISLSLWRKAASKQTNLLTVYIFFWIKNETIRYLWLIQVEVYCWKNQQWGCGIMRVVFHHLQKSPLRTRPRDLEN